MVSIDDTSGRKDKRAKTLDDVLDRWPEKERLSTNQMEQTAARRQAMQRILLTPELSGLLTYLEADRAYSAFDEAGIRRPVAYAAAWMVAKAENLNSENDAEQLTPNFEVLDALSPKEVESWAKNLDSTYSEALGLGSRNDSFHQANTNYFRYMDLEQDTEGLWQVALVIPETIKGTGAAATIEKRWETSRERTENNKIKITLELARAVESLKELEASYEVSLMWGNSGWAAKWDMPYADDDPFASTLQSQSTLETIASPRFVGEDGICEAMEVANEGAATYIFGSIDHIEPDFIALSEWANGKRESRHAVHPEVVEILGDALSVPEKYRALRAVFATEWRSKAEHVIRNARPKGITPVTRIQPVTIDNRLYVTGISPEAVMNAVFTCINEGKSSETFPWNANVRTRRGDTTKTHNHITVTVPKATANELLSLGRVTVFEALSVGFAFYQVYRAEEKEAEGSTYIPTPEHLIIKALMATARGGKDAGKQRSWRSRTHAIIEALRKVDVSYRVYDVERDGYVEVYLKLIDVVAFKDYKDSHGRKVKSWLARRDPIAIFTQKGLGIPRTLPLPDTEAFNDTEAYLWNLINLRLNTLDWMVKNDTGAQGPIKTIRIKRSEIENLGAVQAVEGIKVKTRRGGQPGETASPETIRSRKSRAVDAVAGKLPKVAQAIMGAREAARAEMDQKAAARYPVVSIQPEYIKGERAPRMLNAIILRGWLPKNGSKRQS